MTKKSAGLMLFRIVAGGVEVLLAHPGGPFWAKKDEGAWSIPKGEYADGEDPLCAARREFKEETGMTPIGEFIDLGEIRQQGGKTVRAWALEADFNTPALRFAGTSGAGRPEAAPGSAGRCRPR